MFGTDWLYSLSARAHVREHYPRALPGLANSSIRELSLSGSFGTDVNGHLPHLDHLPMLQTLSLINSSRMDITQGDLSHTENITYLQLDKNVFQKIPKAIAHLKHLYYLDIESKMQNFTLDPNSLEKLIHLKTLILSGTRIDHWPETFPKLPKLEVLTLSRCSMKSFRIAQFYFPELRALNLGENMLTFLSNDAFRGLKNIVSINISFNSISELPPRLFTNHDHLVEIYMQSNNFTKWPKLPCNNFLFISVSQTFLNLQNIHNLARNIINVDEFDISNNRILTWKDSNLFEKEMYCTSGYPNISEFSTETANRLIPDAGIPKQWATKVNFSYNHIAIFSEAMLHSLNALAAVDLGGNMIDCGSCQTSLLQQWLLNTKTRVWNLGESTPLTCYQPPELKNRLVQDVNFIEICSIPRRYLWLGVGAPSAGVITFVLIGGVLFYFRTEVVYLVHLAKVRATSRKKNKSQSNACYDAFVCYSGKNRKWVMRRLVPILECQPENYHLCLFDRDFQLGSHIVSNIVDAIDQSRKVIVVLTQYFIDSKWCQWELEMAQHKLLSEDRQFLVLLELEALERRRLPRLLRFLLDTRPVVRWPRPETAPTVLEAAAQLRRALGPSLRQTLRSGLEPETFASAHNERTPLLVNRDS